MPPVEMYSPPLIVSRAAQAPQEPQYRRPLRRSSNSCYLQYCCHDILTRKDATGIETSETN